MTRLKEKIRATRGADATRGRLSCGLIWAGAAVVADGVAAPQTHFLTTQQCAVCTSPKKVRWDRKCDWRSA